MFKSCEGGGTGLAARPLSVGLRAWLLSLDHKLPLADSVILATARHHQATLWTQDEHFKGLTGVEYIEKK